MILVEVCRAAAIHVARPPLDAVLAVLRQVGGARPSQVLRATAELNQIRAVADA